MCVVVYEYSIGYGGVNGDPLCATLSTDIPYERTE